MSSNIIPHYISLQAAADESGLSYYFLRQLVLDGKIKFIKSGVKVLINIYSLSEYLSQMEQES